MFMRLSTISVTPEGNPIPIKEIPFPLSPSPAWAATHLLSVSMEFFFFITFSGLCKWN